VEQLGKEIYARDPTDVPTQTSASNKKRSTMIFVICVIFLILIFQRGCWKRPQEASSEQVIRRATWRGNLRTGSDRRSNTDQRASNKKSSTMIFVICVICHFSHSHFSTGLLEATAGSVI
jgi:hypothetical protein